MKKNKKFMNEDPVVEVESNYGPGTIGEFIDLLKQFPADGKFVLNGTADIDIDGIGEFKDECTKATIYPRESQDICNECMDDLDERCIADECDTTYEDKVMKAHLSGIARDHHDYLDGIRDAFTDELVESPIMNPNKDQLNFERNDLHPYQARVLDEIRMHNMHVAECMAEMYRRQMAAILEYNTQCLSMITDASNKCMCSIVDYVNHEAEVDTQDF